MSDLEIVGRASDYDGTIALIKARVSEIGISYARLDELAQLPDGWSGKTLGDGQVRQLSWRSFLAMTETVGIACLFYVEPKLVEQMRPHWEQCEVKQRRVGHLARIGKTTLNRLMPAVAREMGRKGGKANSQQALAGKARMAKMNAVELREYQKSAAKAKAKLRKGIMEAARKT